MESTIFHQFQNKRTHIDVDGSVQNVHINELEFFYIAYMKFYAIQRKSSMNRMCTSFWLNKLVWFGRHFFSIGFAGTEKY